MDLIQGFWTTLTNIWGWLSWLIPGTAILGTVAVLVFVVFMGGSLEKVLSVLERVLGPIGAALGKVAGRLLEISGEALAAFWRGLLVWLRIWWEDVLDPIQTLLITAMFVLLAYSFGAATRTVKHDVSDLPQTAASKELWAACKPVIDSLHEDYKFTRR